jgi:hypothetical protein
MATAKDHVRDHVLACGGILVYNYESPRVKLQSRESPLENN